MTYRSPAIAQWVSLVSFSAVKTQDEGRGTFLSEFPSGPGVFIHVGRVLCGYCVAEVDRSTWPWNRKITFVVVAVAAPRRCRPILISFLPSFGGPEITWRFHEYPPSLPPSFHRQSLPRVCVCVSPPARRCRLWRSLTQGIRTAFSGISYA